MPDSIAFRYTLIGALLRLDIATDGIWDLEAFFNAALEAGIYVIARMGPYINAESAAGSFPGWVLRLPWTLCTECPEYLDAITPHLATDDEVIARAEISNGGPVILIQPENEYSWTPGTDETTSPTQSNRVYQQYVRYVLRKAGVTVPFITNDSNWRRRCTIHECDRRRSQHLVGMAESDIPWLVVGCCRSQHQLITHQRQAIRAYCPHRPHGPRPDHTRRSRVSDNGYQFGKSGESSQPKSAYSHEPPAKVVAVPSIRPQLRFPVPEDILNYGGPNYVALTLRAEQSEGAVLCPLTMEATMPILTGYRYPASAPQPQWTERKEAY